MRRTQPLFSATLALLLVMGQWNVALAREASLSQVQDLAERALDDPAALEELRSIDSVDGRSIDLRRALDAPERRDLESRLRILAGSGGGAGGIDADAVRARAVAGEILDGPRYRDAQPPRPFRGVLERIGDFLDRNLSQPLARAWRALVRVVPGGELTLWVVLCVLIVGLVALFVWRVGRRRRRVATEQTRAQTVDRPHGGARELERRAAQAEADGNLAEAIRLRFVAGLMRLDDAGAIDFNTSLTAGQVRRRLRVEPFDRVSRSFEAVTYGGYEATDDDVDASKAGWRDVLARVSG